MRRAMSELGQTRKSGDAITTSGVADPGIQEALGLPCKRGARASSSLGMISFSSWPSAETLLPFVLQSLPVLFRQIIICRIV